MYNEHIIALAQLGLNYLKKNKGYNIASRNVCILNKYEEVLI
jgi:hypothetical protein